MLSTSELLRYMKHFSNIFLLFRLSALVVFSILCSREISLLQGIAAVAVECCSYECCAFFKNNKSKIIKQKQKETRCFVVGKTKKWNQEFLLTLSISRNKNVRKSFSEEH